MHASPIAHLRLPLGAAHGTLAGRSLAAMSVPQAPGCARIVGTPVVGGLPMALLPAVAFAPFGALRRLVSGATPPVRAMEADASAIAHLDDSAARALRGLIDGLDRRRLTPIFGRVCHELRADTRRRRSEDALGPQHLRASLLAALADARALVAASAESPP